MNIKQNLKSIPGILAITLILLVIIVVDVSASPPTNDNIADATIIDYFPYSNSSSTVEASVEDTDPETCGGRLNSIWYKYTPVNDSILNISASTSWQYFITLSIYQMVDGTLTPIACQNAQSGTTYNNLAVAAGETYYFELMARFASEIYPPPQPAPPEDGGNVTINVTNLTPPVNDNFVNAEEIPGTPYSVTANTNYATLEPGETNPCFEGIYRTIWYSFTPTTGGAYTLESSGDWQVMAVYTGSDLYNLQPFTCTYGWGTSTSLIVEAGTQYYIQAAYQWNNGGPITISLSENLPPTNDNFADATMIAETPYSDSVNVTFATVEDSEPGACGWWVARTIWYSFTPTTTASYTAESSGGPESIIAIYKGSDLANLTMVDCRLEYSLARATIRLEAGTTYYFQVFSMYDPWDRHMYFNLYPTTSMPEAYFSYWPGDPLKNESVQFSNDSYDPGGNSFQSCAWDFGDGSTSSECYPIHQFTADGDYNVYLSVTTTDGRTASTTNIVSVRTHDVGITRFQVPTSARAGQTKQINVSIKNLYYAENVQVDLYKVTQNGLEWIGTLTQSIPTRPPNRPQVFTFDYTFTSEDAAIGKATFKAIVTIIDARDAFPADNEAISIATKVTR